MRAYGYVRISRDEDGKKESIGTQKKVVLDFAQQNGMELVEVFEDNNVSGYTFEREGLNKLKELIEDGKVDTLFAKDLSRLGRHNAKVLLFLDYLDDKNVRLMLKSDNYDSESDDDTMLGIKAWYNEMYLKDLSKKITVNIKQNKNIEDRLNKKKDYEKQSEQIRIRIHKKEDEIKGYSRQLAQGFINEKLFLELSSDANKELGKLEEQLNQLEKSSESTQYEKENIIKTVDILKEMIQNKALTNTNISMLIDKIIIKETDEIGEYNRPKLDIEVVWNTPYINIGGITEGLEIAV